MEVAEGTARLISPGTVIDGRFEVLELLGEGGTGQVFKARQAGTERLVAVKVLYESLVTAGDVQQRFQREGRVLSALEHPNVPVFYHFGVWQERFPFIVMEYLEGRTLQSLLLDNEFSVLERIEVCSQVCDALESIFEQGICHRDLKPSNIVIVKEDGRKVVKIIDFGLAGVSDNVTETLTKSGAFLGTLPYVSPEQCLGRLVDWRSDMYSLGCILYECVSGRPPFVGDSPMMYVQLHVAGKASALSALVSNVPPRLESIIHKCLSKEVSDRPSPRKVREVLGGLHQEYSQISVVPASKQRPKSPRLALLLVCVCILFAGLALRRYLNSQPVKLETVQQQRHSSSRTAVLKLAVASLTRNPDRTLELLGTLASVGGSSQESRVLDCAKHTLKARAYSMKSMKVEARKEALLAIDCGSRNGTPDVCCQFAIYTLGTLAQEPKDEQRFLESALALKRDEAKLNRGALKELENYQLRVRISDIRQRLALCFRDQQAHDQSIDQFRQALQEYEGRSSSMGELDELNLQLVRSYLLKGDYAQAEALVFENIETRRLEENRYRMFWVDLLLEVLFYEHRDRAERKCFNAAVAYLKRQAASLSPPVEKGNKVDSVSLEPLKRHALWREYSALIEGQWRRQSFESAIALLKESLYLEPDNQRVIDLVSKLKSLVFHPDDSAVHELDEIARPFSRN